MPEEASIIGLSVPESSRRGENLMCFGPIRLTFFRLHMQANPSSSVVLLKAVVLNSSRVL
jgi:hypothetical protein